MLNMLRISNASKTNFSHTKRRYTHDLKVIYSNYAWFLLAYEMSMGPEVTAEELTRSNSRAEMSMVRC